MASHKLGRTTEDVRRELSDIMRSLKDPRVNGLLSIVNIDLTNELSHCTVYISSLEGMEQAKEAVKGLESASGYIRREIGKRLKLRKLPEFHFIADDGIEYSANIGKKLLELEAERGKKEEVHE